ncbi:DUF2793 domain-containing protein [Sphingomonas sp. VNH70]|uniref:DUF2793 domain-containing protein n=1 Tax=Sphingomonas silueang TaxID=3156617 RepID=UPI0032B3102B
MTDLTARLALPLLHVSQAQKEMTHNEALTRIDALLHGGVERVGEDTPPAGATPGQCWILGEAPTGVWAGRARQVAVMTAGGWRFVAPCEGMTLWWIGGETTAQFRGGQWTTGEVRASALYVGGVRVVGARQAAIAAPTGGETHDSEARSALAAVLEVLREHGLIAR